MNASAASVRPHRRDSGDVARARAAARPGAALVTGAALAVVALGACTVKSGPPNLAGQDVRLTLIHTSDIHSRLFPYEFSPGAIDRGLGLVPKSGRAGDSAIVGGIARMATIIARERAASQRVLHLDSGDIYQGAPVFNVFGGEVEMRAMSRIGLNAMALGNHEFDKGANSLAQQWRQWGGFPILAANYEFYDPNEPQNPKLKWMVAPFAIFNVQGLRVGVIGMGNLSSLTGLIEGGNSLGIVPLETKQAISNAVRTIRGSVDVVVLVTHLGLEEDEGVAQSNTYSDEELLQGQVGEGIDVILGGHLHIVLNPPKEIPRYDENGRQVGRTVVCHSGAFAKYVGRLDLLVHVADPAVPDDKTEVSSYTYKVLPVDDRVPEDGDMVRLLEPYQLTMNTTLNLTQSYAVVPCPKGQDTCPKVVRNDTSGGDSQLGNLVASAMRFRKRVEADFALTNSLGIRADFESGALDLEQMYNVFPFENTITTMYLSGNEIQQTLDFVAARSSERGCRTQTQVSGLWFLSDCRAKIACGPFDASGQRATACTRDAATGALNQDGPFLIGDNCLVNPAGCVPILPSGAYRAAVNDYIATGGSGFAVLKRNTTKFNTGISLRDALIDYVIAQGARCQPSDYSNMIGATCADPVGVRVDCTEDCCCLPTPDALPVCGLECAAFAACEAGGRRPRAFDLSGLPCLDSRVEASAGRILMIGGGQ